MTLAELARQSPALSFLPKPLREPSRPWLAILVCAVLNGALREGVLVPAFGPRVALALSGVSLSAIVILVAVVAVPRLGPPTTSRCVYVGALWLALTVAFEFGFGRLVQHQSWQDLFQAYAFSGGNLWPVVLAVTFIAPLLAVRIRRLA